MDRIPEKLDRDIESLSQPVIKQVVRLSLKTAREGLQRGMGSQELNSHVAEKVAQGLNSILRQNESQQ